MSTVFVHSIGEIVISRKKKEHRFVFSAHIRWNAASIV